jgi:16S rRNA C967 or C1407 C5-methylase (RsmB/RsmF family)
MTQIALLKSGWAHLRPGGRLVYSTCAINPVENERTVERFLNETKDAIIIPASNFEGTQVGIDQSSRLALPSLKGFGPIFWSVLEKKK